MGRQTADASNHRHVSLLTLLGEPVALTIAVAWLVVVYSVILRPPESNVADFFTFWDSARAFRDGLDPYFAHPLRYGLGYNLNIPAAVLVFLPFSYLDLSAAFVTWTTMSVAMFAYAGWRIAMVTGYRRWLLVVSAIFISQTVFSSLQLGQLTALLMVVMTEAWIADRENRPLAAGVLLGLVVGLKPFLGLFVLYAIWRRSGPLIGGLLASLAAVWIVGLIATGTGGYASWFEVLRRVTWTAHSSNASVLACLQRLLTNPPGLSVTPVVVREAWVTPLSWALLLVVSALGLRAFARDADRDRTWLVIIFGSLLISPLGWAYYAPIAGGPLAAYLKRASVTARWVAGVGYGFLCIPYTVMHWPYGVVLSVLVASASTWGVLALFTSALIGTTTGAKLSPRHVSR